MYAPIRESEITWAEPVRIQFGFAGIAEKHAITIMREIMQESWPEIRRELQCVYIIRLTGDVAVAYRDKHSPVIYIGAGNAYARLYKHIEWLASLVVSVPQLGIEVRIAQVLRKNKETLYQHIEADLLRWFCEDYATLPWFNRQRERSKEGKYEYEPSVEQFLRGQLGVGKGTSYHWAIRPTKINDLHEPYDKGAVADE